MISVERSQPAKFRKIILEENFTFRSGAGCSVVLLKQIAADIVRHVNMNTGLYTAPNQSPKFWYVREVNKITKVLEDGRENG